MSHLRYLIDMTCLVMNSLALSCFPIFKQATSLRLLMEMVQCCTVKTRKNEETSTYVLHTVLKVKSYVMFRMYTAIYTVYTI